MLTSVAPSGVLPSVLAIASEIKPDNRQIAAAMAKPRGPLEPVFRSANGMTNSQIADKLVISENTVKGHVSNILSKLHLAYRTQVAVYAWQKGALDWE